MRRRWFDEGENCLRTGRQAGRWTKGRVRGRAGRQAGGQMDGRAGGRGGRHTDGMRSDRARSEKVVLCCALGCGACQATLTRKGPSNTRVFKGKCLSRVPVMSPQGTNERPPPPQSRLLGYGIVLMVTISPRGPTVL